MKHIFAYSGFPVITMYLQNVNLTLLAQPILMGFMCLSSYTVMSLTVMHQKSENHRNTIMMIFCRSSILPFCLFLTFSNPSLSHVSSTTITQSLVYSQFLYSLMICLILSSSFFLFFYSTHYWLFACQSFSFFLDSTTQNCSDCNLLLSFIYSLPPVALKCWSASLVHFVHFFILWLYTVIAPQSLHLSSL